MDEQETALYHAVLITGITLGIAFLFFLFTIYRQYHLNKKLFHQKLRAEIDTLERERARTAADLHDDLAPSFLAIKLQISSFDLKDEADHLVLEETSLYIDQQIQRVREIASDLYPNSLERKGLAIALQDFINDFKKNHPLQISLSCADLSALPADINLQVFRIIKEITHNTVKHANATELQLILAVMDNFLQLDTRDNGSGFDTSNINLAKKGLGLNNIFSRTEILGGKWYLTSTPKAGTKYQIIIPISRSDAPFS
jgi:two-component system, NarL family, sensor kinase